MLTPESKVLIKEYEEVKLQIISLEERAKELKEEILPSMNPEEKIQLTQGKLYLKSMPKWVYSPRVESLDQELKETKKAEQADGTAEMIENYVLEYRRDKVESVV